MKKLFALVLLSVVCGLFSGCGTARSAGPYGPPPNPSMYDQRRLMYELQ